MSIRHLIASLVLALAGSTAYAQQTAQQPAPTAPADSVKTMPMHDHGAERGMPMATSHMGAASAPTDAASAPKKAASKTKLKGHDHAKFHKTM